MCHVLSDDLAALRLTMHEHAQGNCTLDRTVRENIHAKIDHRHKLLQLEASIKLPAPGPAIASHRGADPGATSSRPTTAPQPEAGQKIPEPFAGLDSAETAPSSIVIGAPDTFDISTPPANLQNLFG